MYNVAATYNDHSVLHSCQTVEELNDTVIELFDMFLYGNHTHDEHFLVSIECMENDGDVFCSINNDNVVISQYCSIPHQFMHMLIDNVIGLK